MFANLEAALENAPAACKAAGPVVTSAATLAPINFARKSATTPDFERLDAPVSGFNFVSEVTKSRALSSSIICFLCDGVKHA